MSALPMLKPPRRFAFFALFVASLGIFCAGSLFAGADQEPLYYIYQGQQKALTLDAEHIAVRMSATPPNGQSAAALPMSLISRGFTDADVVARPEAGWMIVNAQNILSAPGPANQLASPAGAAQSDASTIHTTINSVLNSGDPVIEFVSPVFRDTRDGPIIITPAILIGFKQDFPRQERNRIRTTVPEGAEAQQLEFSQPDDEQWQVQSKDGFEVLSRANALASNPGVAYAEPDMLTTGYSNLVSSDPNFGDSWGLNNTGQSGGLVGFDMEAPAAWDVTIGSALVIVLILDGGVQQDHPDINQVSGKDFTSDAASNPNGGPFGQYDNHGTWVAGCVSARINNGLGTAGIAPGVMVAAARCHNRATANGTFSVQSSWVVNALNWGQSIGARVSNNSNGYDFTSSAIESAYANTRSNGMVHFAASGNDSDGSIAYPSSIPDVNAVGAATRYGVRAYFSNYGAGLKFMAPGMEIFTTDRTGSFGGSSGDYITVDGTSFASPYAAGVAALVISQDPGVTASDVESRMQNGCTDMASAGYDQGTGYGLIDAYRSLRRITSNLNPPGAPIGSNFSYQITANNNPASFSATGLPAGLQLNATTGLISGIPTASGTFQVVVIAYGPNGDATATVQIVIIGPNITSSLSTQTVDSGANFSYQITATNNPSSYDALGLPPGLQINIATGLISGTPNTQGTYQVTLIAHTSLGDANGSLQFVVNPPAITSGLYPTSFGIGTDFNYQISANGGPTSYDAIGLPPGLELDQATGRISGVVNLSGSYNVTLIAHTPYGDAVGNLSITVIALVTPDIPEATFSMSITVLVADPQRPRIYFGTTNGLVILDTVTLTTETFPMPIVRELSLSADGSKLWFARDGQSGIGIFDLNTLTLMPDLPTPVRPSQIREGLSGRMYVSGGDGQGNSGIFQIDSATGAVQRVLTNLGYVIEISPDRKTLFAGPQSWADPFAKYDISTAVPALVQTRTQSLGCYSVAVSHDGKLVCFVPPFYLGPNPTPEFSTADLNNSPGSFTWNAWPGEVAFSADDSRAFQAGYQPVIGVFDTQTCALTRTMNLFNASWVSQIAVDSTNTYLVAYVSGNQNQVQLYRIKPKTSVGLPKSLVNVSTRTFVQTGDNVEIGGFIMQGNQPKKVVVRAIGPSLAAYGLPAVNDPVLELHDSTGAIIATNDNWNSRRQDVLSTGLAPPDEHEAVIVTTLQPGAYTAILRGLNGATGTALFELFDVDPNNSRIANISTRANVGTGDNVMIGGFIIGGDQQTRVMARAIGPSLTQYGVNGVLQDPVLELHDASGSLIVQNDDWRSDQEQAINGSGLAPSDDRESAILATLSPGNYTAIVRGKNETTGVALVEIYNLESN